MPITIFKENGDAMTYETVAERLPKFEAAFPASEGWRVVRAHEPSLAKNDRLARLWEKALDAGQNPKELGLPAFKANAFVFTATLLDKEGHVVRNASAYAEIFSRKDWEAAETAAFQRLMAACGFGGDMDLDEAYDLEQMGRHHQPVQSPAPVAELEEVKPHDDTESGVEAEFSEQAEAPEPEPEGSEPESGSPGTEGVAESVPTKPTPEKPKAANVTPAKSREADAVFNQLRHQARLLGEEPPEVTTVAEARKELRRMIKRGHQRARAS